MLSRMGDIIAEPNAAGHPTEPNARGRLVDISAPPRTWWFMRPHRSIVVCGVVLLAIVVAGTTSLLSNLRNRDLADKEHVLENLTLVLAEQIDRSFQAIALVQAAEVARMKTLGIASPEDFAARMSGYETYRRLNTQVGALPYVDAFILTDAAGKLINFSRSWPAPSVTIPDQDPHEALGADPRLVSLVGRPLLSPVTGRWEVPLARKFTGQNGEFLGVLTGVMEAQYFEKLFHAVTNTPGGTIALFRRDGTLLVRFPHKEEAVGEAFPNSKFLNLLATADHGTGREIGMIDGQERLVSSRSLAHYPLALVATITVADALANWRHGAIVMTAAALTVGLLIGGVVFLSIWAVGRKLREQNLQLDAALHNMSQGLVMFDAAARLVVCNDRYRQMYKLAPNLAQPGRALMDILKYRVTNGTFSGDPEEWVRDLRATLAKKQIKKYVMQTGDGRTTTVVNHPMAGGGWVATHEDITEAKRQEASFLLLFNSNPVPMWVYDHESLRFLAVNDAAVAHYGYGREQFLGMTAMDIRPAEERERFVQIVRRGGVNDEDEETWRHQKADGTEIDVAVYTRALNYEGHTATLVAVIDVTARKQAEAKISYLARHDSLTGLGNRAVLNEKLEEALARSRRDHETFAVLLLDLDGFKHVNDTLGHAAGDELLKELAKRLNAALSETDVLTRLGGDEFAIIQSSETDQREAAIALAVRLLEVAGIPFNLDGHDVTVGTSIGIAVAPEDGTAPGDLLQKADLALYRVKSDGRNNFRFFDRELGTGAMARLGLLNDLRAALSRDQFELHYQPIFDAKTGRPSGVEALVRWRHPVHGLMPPDRFIPLAEETGLMEAIGDWIIEKACADATAWPADIKVAINLSAVQFRTGKLFDVILCALVESGMAPERLEFEITESVLMQNTESNRIILQQLKNIGIAIVLDDFGTGYSSLNYLTMFPFDKIKIDKSFTQGLATRADCAAIVASVLTLARGLDIAVTVEGVETTQQLELLRAAGVHDVQGYLFARPAPLSELNFSALERKGRGLEAA